MHLQSLVAFELDVVDTAILQLQIPALSFHDGTNGALDRVSSFKNILLQYKHIYICIQIIEYMYK